MGHELDLRIVQDVSAALLIGALISVERGKRKSLEGEFSSDELRTFVPS